MNTNESNSLRPLVLATLALGAFATAALAGPGPQFWNKPPTPAPTPTVADAKCSGCKTTTQVTGDDRGPAGKGVAVRSVASTTHACSSCTGTVVATKADKQDTMISSPACTTLLCCK